MLAPFGTDDRKDTARNAVETEELGVHVVTRDLAKAMNATGATLPADEDEFERAGLAKEESTLYDATEIGSSSTANST